MCRIGITLNTATPDGTSITSASGRYRLVGNPTWITFSITLSNPQTPNITTLGNYELQVNVTNSLGTVSDWANGSFEISDNCGPISIGCREYRLTNLGNSSTVFPYIDCIANDPNGNGNGNGGPGVISIPNQGDSQVICGVLPLDFVEDNPTIQVENLGPCTGVIGL